ncbi:MAG: hypothetical protein H6719_35005 [Sandaracinaceae bacterium]|nr:hypothetical protein [Sandaracinaceae bacterium]
MTWRLALALLFIASPAAADAIGDEVDYPRCESGRALNVDHGQYECIDAPAPGGGGGCSTVPGGSTPLWVIGATLGSAAALRRRRS